MNFDEKMVQRLDECKKHFGIQEQDGKSIKNFNISENPLKHAIFHNLIPAYIDPKKKTRVIFDYDPDFPYSVMQVLEDQGPETMVQVQPGGME